MRVDTNVPIKNGRVVDGKRGRLARAAPEIEAYARRGAKVIILSHLGRPKGKRVKELSNAPVAKGMSRILGRQVDFVSKTSGPSVKNEVTGMLEGGILWLENVRFDEREVKNSRVLAKEWAELADVYVNNAFGACHRKHASVHAITKELPSVAGGLIREEVQELSKPFEKPFILVMGGIKLETKLPVLRHLAPQADVILAGGGVALTLASAALGRTLCPVGRSIKKSEVTLAQSFLKRFGDKLQLPVDVRVGGSIRAQKTTVRFIEDVQKGEEVFDIGPKTARQFRTLMQGAGSIVWNGSMGVLEHAEGVRGTRSIAKSISRARGARTILGGGDTVAFVERSGHAKRFTFISTGGGAMLEFLSGKKLPGLEVLKK